MEMRLGSGLSRFPEPKIDEKIKISACHSSKFRSEMTSKYSRWIVYLLRCNDGTIYCGITTDLKRRVSQHNSGEGAKYIVAARRPARCVWKQFVANRSEALKLEYRIKRFKTAKKELLVSKKMKVPENKL